MSKAALDKLASEVERLQKQIAALELRLAHVEPMPAAATPARAVETASPEIASQEPPAEISQETLLAIASAVAAYLGERAHIRAVRLISTSRWSQEGRVSIQASHYLNRG